MQIDSLVDIVKGCTALKSLNLELTHPKVVDHFFKADGNLPMQIKSLTVSTIGINHLALSVNF